MLADEVNKLSHVTHGWLGIVIGNKKSKQKKKKSFPDNDCLFFLFISLHNIIIEFIEK